MDDSSRRVSRDATSCSGTGSQTATESISCGIDRDYSLRGGDVEDRLSGQGPARSLRSRWLTLRWTPRTLLRDYVWRLLQIHYGSRCGGRPARSLRSRGGRRRPPLHTRFATLLGVDYVFGFLLGHGVQAHEVGGAGGLARAGDYSQNVLGLQQAAADEVLLSHGDHLLGGTRLAAADGMDSPVEIHAVDDGLNVSESVNRGLGTVLGNHAGGVAAFREDGDRAHGQVFGSVGDGLADGFSDGESAALAAAAHLSHVRDIAFGLDDNAGHDFDGLTREFSAGSFARQHERVGAIEDGVGYVAGLGARGARVLDHGFEHLCGGDDRLAPGCRPSDHILLNDRNFFGRHLDAKISTGDHDTVRDFEDFFQVINRLRLFQLGDDRDIALVRGDDTFDLRNVGGGADE